MRRSPAALPATSNLVLDRFRTLCETDPDRRLFTFVGDDGADERVLDARDLAAAADLVARSLRGWGLRPGDRAVLVYPPSLEFIAAYLGCLAAGVLPVPVYPPDPLRRRGGLEGFARIVEDCGATVALTNGAYDRARRAGSVAGLFGRSGPRWPALTWYRTAAIEQGARHRPDPASWHVPAGPDEPAFLQYTSGSTGSPKGVVVTHGNLAHEIAANVVDLRLGPDTVGVFWLPQYHDMGLINVILSTSLGNSRTHLMSPLTFLREPALWLDVMSRTRATITSAPNFGYELAVRRSTPEQRARWDLSALEMAIVAAEPVRAPTLQAFTEAFAVSGLRPNAMFAAYGLAENTASVTNRGQGMARLDQQQLELGHVVPVPEDFAGPVALRANCGRSSKDGDLIRIVDPDTRRACAPDEVGEIWVRSSTTAAGYYGKPELSAEVFAARIEGEDETGYLRTGDLGFLLDGDVYVSGRRKDLIIVRGRNLHPADIEDSVRGCHVAVRPGGVAAFAVAPMDAQDVLGGEALGLFVETRERSPHAAAVAELAEAVREAIRRDHQLELDVLVIGSPGLVRKTTSGKVRRSACATAAADGSIDRDPHRIAVLRGGR